MIYLFSQIAISLFLAAIVGGAAGWLVNRARSGKQIDHLESLISRQHQQVNEAQTQVSILTGDFDDLKQHSESEIAALSQDNQRIPALAQNLEKSQLLVNQLMQQHKTEKFELTAENEKLTTKAKQANDREQAITKLQAELDIERRRNQQLSADATSSGAAHSNGAASDVKAETLAVHAAEGGSKTEVSQSEQQLRNKSTRESKMAWAGISAEKDEPVDRVENNIDRNSIVNSVNGSATQGSLSFVTDADNSNTGAQSTEAQTPSAAETEAELLTLRDQLAEDSPRKSINVPNNHAHTLAETTVDQSHLEPLFDSVAQHDDLKQIFGIGPVTEKTLNKLGITAYSQLAELKQYDIEKIADALQIFPGRIERDNWVGGARAQLEEMLEDL